MGDHGHQLVRSERGFRYFVFGRSVCQRTFDIRMLGNAGVLSTDFHNSIFGCCNIDCIDTERLERTQKSSNKSKFNPYDPRSSELKCGVGIGFCKGATGALIVGCLVPDGTRRKPDKVELSLVTNILKQTDGSLGSMAKLLGMARECCCR